MPRDKVSREDSCDGCGTDLHCCAHCRSFNPSRSKQCSEPRAEWVRDKHRANSCRYFSPRTSVNLTSSRGSSSATDARAAFHNLFKK